MNARIANSRRKFTLLSLLCGLLLVVAGMSMSFSSHVMAQDATEESETVDESDSAVDDEASEEGEDTSAEQDIPEVPEGMTVANGDAYCTVCHTPTTTTTRTFQSGETISVAVDPMDLANSVHGTNNPEGALSCTDCHGEMTFPHLVEPPISARLSTLEKSISCTECHTEHTENIASDVHYLALVEGNLRAASCVDCHGSHDIQTPHEPRTNIIEACGTCHTTTTEQYVTSVHGEALMSGDPNVPTCIDCHGVHGIQHPTTAQFRNRSPEICADCHGDDELMAEYGISTYVFESYLTDFHGKTVAMFAQSDPNVPSNKAVCYDCHGVHDIQRMTDQTEEEIQANLQGMCQQCHPDAGADFPAAWVGHFPPSLDNYPLVFLVDTFYLFLIPAVVLGFAFLVGTDIFRIIRTRIFGSGHSHDEHEE